VAGVFLASLVVFVGLSAYVDLFAAGAQVAWPRLLLFAFLGVPATLTAIACRKRWMLASCVAGWLCVVVLTVVPWHPRKVFVRSLSRVTVRMTVDEVEHVMGRYIKGRGAKWPGSEQAAYPVGEERDRASGTMTYRWNAADTSYDSDWGLVTFDDGRVTAVRFLGD
jgi:hypothetical protein